MNTVFVAARPKVRVAVNSVFAYTRPTSLSEAGNADAVYLKFRGEQMARSHRVQG